MVLHTIEHLASQRGLYPLRITRQQFTDTVPSVATENTKSVCQLEFRDRCDRNFERQISAVSNFRLDSLLD